MVLHTLIHFCNFLFLLILGPKSEVGGQNPFGSEIPLALGYLADGQKKVGKVNFASEGFATIES